MALLCFKLAINHSYLAAIEQPAGTFGISSPRMLANGHFSFQIIGQTGEQFSD